MNCNTFNKKYKGFLLIELLIAIAIFSFLSLITMSFFVYIKQLNQNAQNKIEVINFASNIMELLQSHTSEQVYSLLELDKQKKFLINIQNLSNIKSSNKNYYLYKVTVKWNNNKKQESLSFNTGSIV